MRRRFFALVCLCLAIPLFAQDCSIYNYSWQSGSPTGTWDYQSDTKQHNTGHHSGGSLISGTCTYSGAYSSGACSVTCNATAESTAPNRGIYQS